MQCGVGDERFELPFLLLRNLKMTKEIAFEKPCEHSITIARFKIWSLETAKPKFPLGRGLSLHLNQGTAQTSAASQEAQAAFHGVRRAGFPSFLVW